MHHHRRQSHDGFWHRLTAPRQRPVRAESGIDRRDLEESGGVDGGTRRAGVVSVLLGVAVALAIMGVGARFEAALSNGADMRTIATAVALWAMAVGVRAPQRFALWVALAAWRRFVVRGQTSPMSSLIMGVRPADHAQYWVLLSMVALLAGVTLALLILGIDLTLAGHRWMQLHFIWPAVARSILDVVALLLAGFVPFMLLGLAISLVHRLYCPLAKWETTASGWLLMGAGIGVLIGWVLEGATSAINLTLLSAALPVLMVSLVSAMAKPRDAIQLCEAGTSPTNGLPDWTDRWPRLLRASVVAIGVVSVWVMGVWTSCLAVGRFSSEVLLAGMLVALGLGVWTGCRRKPSGFRSIGGFGVAGVGAGAAVAIGAAIVHGPAAGDLRAVTGLVLLGVASLGLAAAYGRQTLLARVASRSAAGATMLARVLALGALAVWIGIPLAVERFGPRASLAVPALLIVALGAVLVAHEPAGTLRTRRARLGAALTVLVLAVLLVSTAWMGR